VAASSTHTNKARIRSLRNWNLLSQSFGTCKKTGFSEITAISNLQEISNKNIKDTIKLGKDEAINVIKELGMSMKEGKWEEVTLKPVAPKDGDNDDDNDEDDDAIPFIEDKHQPTSDSVNTKEEKLEDIENMNTVGLVNEKVVDSLQGMKMKRMPSSTIPMYGVKMVDSKVCASNQHTKHSEYVQVTHNGRTIYIRKATGVWLFQEYERLSSDRVFRVRMIQPNSSESQTNVCKVKSNADSLSAKHETVRVGDRGKKVQNWPWAKYHISFTILGKVAVFITCRQ